MNGRRLLHLIYVGTYMARMHIPSYAVAFVNNIMWFLVVYIPLVLYSPDPLTALYVFMPGVFGMGIASSSMWTSTEFLRWYLYQGLTDMFRECGLGVLHYLLSAIHIDVLIFGVFTYLSMAFATAFFTGLSPYLMVPHNAFYFALAIAVALPTYLLCGSLVGYLYTVTPIGGVWTNIIQMGIMVGTVVPPTVAPDPRLLLLNPATIVAELVRASYSANTLDINTIIIVSIAVIPLYTVLAYLVSRSCEKYIAVHGLKYRV